MPCERKERIEGRPLGNQTHFLSQAGESSGSQTLAWAKTEIAGSLSQRFWSNKILGDVDDTTLWESLV